MDAPMMKAIASRYLLAQKGIANRISTKAAIAQRWVDEFQSLSLAPYDSKKTPVLTLEPLIAARRVSRMA